ncbi:MAG: class I SAM-dependent methyltransferase [Miltoncostaeaceae bacterium]
MDEWGEGDYGRTAEQLAPAAEAAVTAAGVASGQRVLDVGCGTGNVAMEAAARGAQVTAVEPSVALIEQAEERLRAAGFDARFVAATAEGMEVEDRAYDAVLSVFAVIFSQDPAEAVRRMARCARPGGVLVIASWTDDGPIARLGEILRDALPAQEAPRARWHDEEWIGRVVEDAGASSPRTERRFISMRGESPEALFAELEEHHPAWRAARRNLHCGLWQEVRDRTIALFHDANEDPAALLITSPYLLTRATA